MHFSPLIIGSMRWGIWGANHSEKAVQQLIETALSEDLTTFDHADIYGDYTTEKLFGDAFHQVKIDRQSVQFITKCGIEMPCANSPFKIKSYNYTNEYIMRSVENSLRNLRTDYLDVLLLHRPSPLMDPHEIAETFSTLQSQQKVKEFGVSNFSPSQFDLIDNVFPLITNQVEISLNQTKTFNNGTLDQMMIKGLRPMAWSVMGNYFSEISDQNVRIKNVLDELCSQYNAPENQLLLAFLLKHPAKILPVIGTSKAETVKELKKSVSLDLDRVDWFRLLKASTGENVA